MRCTHSAVWCVPWHLSAELKWPEHEADQSSPSVKVTNSSISAACNLSRVSLWRSVACCRKKQLWTVGYHKMRLIFDQISYCQHSKFMDAQLCGVNHKPWFFSSADTWLHTLYTSHVWDCHTWRPQGDVVGTGTGVSDGLMPCLPRRIQKCHEKSRCGQAISGLRF